MNDEFSALDSLLRQLPSCLNPGGRVAILTFHSGEDRREKKSFAAGRDAGLYSEISEEVIRLAPPNETPILVPLPPSCAGPAGPHNCNLVFAVRNSCLLSFATFARIWLKDPRAQTDRFSTFANHVICYESL